MLNNQCNYQMHADLSVDNSYVWFYVVFWQSRSKYMQLLRRAKRWLWNYQNVCPMYIQFLHCMSKPRRKIAPSWQLKNTCNLKYKIFGNFFIWFTYVYMYIIHLFFIIFISLSGIYIGLSICNSSLLQIWNYINFFYYIANYFQNCGGGAVG